MIGQVQKPLVPMIITFDKKKVDMVCEILGDSIKQAYEFIDMFGDPEGDEYD